jgi:hypothetical protein
MQVLQYHLTSTNFEHLVNLTEQGKDFQLFSDADAFSVPLFLYMLFMLLLSNTTAQILRSYHRKLIILIFLKHNEK